MSMIWALLIAAATQPVAMAPQGPWVVDGEENLCVMQRKFTGENGDMALIFQPLLDLDTMELSVFSSDGFWKQKTGDATVAISPGDRKFKGTYLSVYIPGKKLRMTRLTIDRAVLASLRDGDTLSIDAKPIMASFAIKRPEKAMPILKDCVDSLKKSWGVDPDSKAAVAVSPIGNPARYFSSDSYPTEAVRSGNYGRVVALLQIGTSGKVEQCRIVSSAGKVLNGGTCEVAMTIRFKPARDKDDKPIASTYLLPVNWMAP